MFYSNEQYEENKAKTYENTKARYNCKNDFTPIFNMKTKTFMRDLIFKKNKSFLYLKFMQNMVKSIKKLASITS